MEELSIEEAAELVGGIAEEEGVFVKRAASIKAVRSVGLDLQALCEKRGMKWSDGLKDRHFSYWASDERPDSDREIVKQDWDFSQFEVNSPLAFMHQWQGLPIGKCVDWQIVPRSDKTYKGPALKIEAVFAEGDETAERVYRLVSQGILTSGSCGFWSKKVMRLSPEDAKKQGADRILSGNVLKEFTPCMIGANPGAMVMKAQGLLPGDINLVRELTRLSIVKGPLDKSHWDEYELGMLVVAKKIFPGVEFEPHTELDTPIQVTEPVDRIREIELKMVRVEQTLSDIRSLLERAPSEDELLAKELGFLG